MSYIKREFALSAVQNLPSAGGCSAVDRDDAENAILNIPAADVVEVVRCRDCLWWSDKGLDPILNRRDGKCGRPLGEYIDSVDFETSEYDFCSAAERREG